MTAAAIGPRVAEDAVELTVTGRRLRGVALLHELRRPRRIEFERAGAAWKLFFPRPEADRMEYLLELTHAAGSTQVTPDATNPLRAGGPFGDKSVIEFPGYEAPHWVFDDDTALGSLSELPLDGIEGAFLWCAADTDPARPLPLLIVHDGPEYADYSMLLRLLDHLVDFGEIPDCRAVLLPPPADRNDAYSASAHYSHRLAARILRAVAERAPFDKAPVLMGASLGALAALNAHVRNPGAFGGLFLQSGSFFRQRFDSHERDFGRYRRITRFVGTVHGKKGIIAPVPTTITCGTAEENLENNQAVAAALARRGFEVVTFWNRDAHNWVAWRDALYPHLPELLLRAWT